MSIEVVAGNPNYSSSGTNGFIPEIWSSRFGLKFYPKTVFGAISNTNYEGEIKAQGDKVHIPTIPDGTVKTYHKGMKLTYEQLESPEVILDIDFAEYFGCQIDNIDKYQSHLPLMDKWADMYAQKMKIKIDSRLLGSVYADVHASNKGATAGIISEGVDLGITGAPVAVTAGNVIKYLIGLGLVLDEQNVPEDGRWVVLPSWVTALIKQSDLKDASLTGDSKSLLRMAPHGRVGMIDRFTVYGSNQILPVADSGKSCYHALFGHIEATTFAAQMTDMDTLKLQDTFGSAIRGLQVYGFKVILPEAIGDWYIYGG